MSTADLLDSDPVIYSVQTKAAGPAGAFPSPTTCSAHWPSGDLFGLTQNAGMGWKPAEMLGPQFLILSTQGGIRADGRHADRARLSHRPLGSRPARAGRGPRNRSRSAASRSPRFCHRSVRRPHAGHRRACSTACPIATTRPSSSGRLIRSLPQRRGVLGVATCDKGLPAMMMALAGMRDLPGVLVPGGVTLPPTRRRRRRQGAIDRRPLSRTARSRWRKRPSSAAARALTRAAAASSSAPRPRRRSSARRSACRCRTRPSRRPASRSGSTWRAAQRRALCRLEERRPHDRATS